jgi:hypothetical protein
MLPPSVWSSNVWERVISAERGQNHAFPASRPACRASDGVMRKRQRNARLKCDRSLKPAANAAAVIVLSARRESNSIS